MEKFVYVTNTSSTASGPPSPTGEGFCKPSISATDKDLVCERSDLGLPRRRPLQSKKIADGYAATTDVAGGASPSPTDDVGVCSVNIQTCGGDHTKPSLWGRGTACGG